MGKLELSTNCRKSLTVQLGEAAGSELADLLRRMADRIERLEKSKVDVIPVVSRQATRLPSRARKAV
jgi:hypothetical protein